MDSVMSSLASNPDRKFTYVEMAFFARWWRRQSDATKASVRDFVRKGQLDFSIGGWVMSDEGAPDYLGMIDQTTFGHRFLMQEFGVVPRVGWQIDPFGHSSTHAALSAAFGFDALFLGRIADQDFATRTYVLLSS